MDESVAPDVLVRVVEVRGGREISWGNNLAEQLGNRAAEIRAAIQAGAATVAAGLRELPDAKGWVLGEVEVSFGVTLTAEAGVLLSKASAEATFEVTVSYQREQAG
jgi:hypothetical protein